MNRSMIKHILFRVMEIIAALLLIPCVVALIYQETEGLSYLAVAAVTYMIGWLGSRKLPENKAFYAKEGFVVVALSWMVIGVIGAIPFVITGEIPNFVDALFETISGFTTTGASILADVEALSHCSLFWRSFTHWIGGMGVLVFILAIMPLAGGYDLHIMRAESPGPSVGKLVPRMKHTAMLLYGIYMGMTVIEIILLIISGMPIFDAFTISFGTAGTGGFGVRNSSIAEYSNLCQYIITTFMILFGVNFIVYYLLLMKKWKQAVKCEEVRWYLAIIVTSIILITVNLKGYYQTLGETIKHASFQVGSIITTTGFSTSDFNGWPALSKTILVILMFIGACAGSTGGGLKVSRVLIYFKIVINKIDTALHPKRVKSLYLEKRALSTETISEVQGYLAAYVLIFTMSVLLISVDNMDLITNFTAVTATINNIGPGLEVVGPSGNFSVFSWFSKIILIIDMLVGRLEIFPMLVLMSPEVWKIKKKR